MNKVYLLWGCVGDYEETVDLVGLFSTKLAAEQEMEIEMANPFRDYGTYEVEEREITVR